MDLEESVVEPEIQSGVNPFYDRIRHLYPADCIYQSSCASSVESSSPSAVCAVKRKNRKHQRKHKTVHTQEYKVFVKVIKCRKMKGPLDISICHPQEVKKPRHPRPCRKRYPKHRPEPNYWSLKGPSPSSGCSEDEVQLEPCQGSDWGCSILGEEERTSSNMSYVSSSQGFPT